MNKISSIIIALIFCLTFTGCENDDETEVKFAETEISISAEQTKESTTAKETEPAQLITDAAEVTTYTSAPQQNSTEMVDKLTSDAKLKAETATPEELQKALDNLRALSGNFYTSNDTMHSVIYNSQLLYYYYKDTNTPYEQAGFYAFVAVKYVYRGIDTADSEDTADNLTKFAASLMQCDDIYTSATAEETQAQTQPETQPETQAIYTVPPVQQGQTVYVTPTGKKYHYDSNCNGGSYNPTDLDTAKRMGLEPCKKCT